MKVLPETTIVVPAHNEEYTLRNCLEALRKQTYLGHYEIIVVDNASTDATAAIARELGCTVIHEPKRGYIHAVTAGFAGAAGEIIASTDADTIVPAEWLESLVKGLCEPGVVGYGGAFVFSDGPSWLRLVGKIFGPLTWHISGANMAIWRWAFERIGGFDPTVNLGADVDLHLRLRRIGKVIVNHSFAVPTSSRRFAYSFFRTVWRNYFNDFCFVVFGKPAYYDFPAIRMKPKVFIAGDAPGRAFPLTRR
jgi:glycosyltransferase involved in cell wall biosynthesis